MMHLLRHLALLACSHGFDFKCEHIDGVQNTTADVLSRSGDCAAFRALQPRAALGATRPVPLPLPPPRDPPPVPQQPRRERRSAKQRAHSSSPPSRRTRSVSTARRSGTTRDGAPDSATAVTQRS
jgi:hypothetical protein